MLAIKEFLGEMSKVHGWKGGLFGHPVLLHVRISGYRAEGARADVLYYISTKPPRRESDRLLHLSLR